MSTYPPRVCGIATFTHHLAATTGDREIVALHPTGSAAPYPLEVHHRIRRDELADYAKTARALERCVDVVSIQYADGIWGGQDGTSVNEFVSALTLPAVATLHTLPEDPAASQRQIIGDLVSAVDTTIVMSQAAAAILATDYGVDPRRIEFVPHGVPDLPLVDAESMKPGLGVDGNDVMLSFGMLGPAKGLELAIDALPQIIADRPTAVYVIVGATRPDTVPGEGEAYRATLVAHVRRLGMDKHVRFIDRHVGRVELTRWLQAADVVVSPNPDLGQAVSGTLAYAMAAGRAVVSTPFAYARELLDDGRGILVEPDPASLATAVTTILGGDETRLAMGRRAYDHTRPMVWSAVGAEYQRVLRQVSGGAPPPPARPTTQAALHA